MFRLTSLIAVSLFIHFLMYEGVWLLPAMARPTSNEVEVEVIDQKDLEKTVQRKNDLPKPVIENSTTKEPVDMSQPANFVADKNQRFEKQTRATKLGVFKNGSRAKGSDETVTNSGSKTPASSEGDVPEFAREVQQQMARVQESTTPYELPREIQSGSATNLNADAHIYASFYNRVVNLFYPRWSERLDTIFQRLPTDIRRELSGKSWVTEIEIWLNSEGLFQEGLIMTSSGFPPFDQAGLNAFKNAKFFPNPPRSKVEADGGRVRLRYRIRVNVY